MIAPSARLCLVVVLAALGIAGGLTLLFSLGFPLLDSICYGIAGTIVILLAVHVTGELDTVLDDRREQRTRARRAKWASEPEPPAQAAIGTPPSGVRMGEATRRWLEGQRKRGGR